MTANLTIYKGSQQSTTRLIMKITNLCLFRNKPLHLSTAIIVVLLVGFILLLDSVGEGHASQTETAPIFLPLVHSNARQAPVPSLVASIPLNEALCPNDMTYNSHSDILYVANEKSDNISLISGMDFAGNIATGQWPIYIKSDPKSDRVYLSHVWDGIRVLNGSEITGSIPPAGESYFITVNPVNDYTYVTDLHGQITIIRDSARVMDLIVPEFEGHTIVWQLAADYDLLTGLTYFASWRYGALTIVDGTEVVDQFSFEGEGASDMVVDAHRRLIYITNNRAYDDEKSPNNISIVDMDSHQVTSIYSAKYSYRVGLDPVTGFVYATNPEDNSVTVLQGDKEVATYWSGKKPREVAVDPVTGYAYITNSEENSISVFRDGVPVTKIELPEDMGFKPWYMTIDEGSGRVYVLNRSSREKPTYPDKQVLECKEPWVHILD